MVYKKKIVLITHNFPYGGASSNLMRYFSLALASQNNAIEVVIPSGFIYGNQVTENKKRIGKIESVKYRYLGFKNHPKNILGKITDNFLGLILPFFFLIYKSIKKDLDIIIVYHPLALSLVSILAVKILLRKKLVVILPEFYEKPALNRISFSLINWYNFYISIRYLVKYSDKFIVLSTYLQEYVKARTERKIEMMIMPNLTDPKRFEISDIRPFKDNKTTIGYVGIPVRKDGIFDLLESFAVLISTYPNAHLLVIGDITNGNSVIPCLIKYADGLGIPGECITFSGLQSYYSIPELLLSCQILALTRPSGVFAEAGFPTKLGEYFACKRPVLITKVGDIPKYFKNEEHLILVEPGNKDEIVRGFEKLICDPDLAAKLSRNGFNWMDENLNYLNQAKKLSDFVTG